MSNNPPNKTITTPTAIPAGPAGEEAPGEMHAKSENPLASKPEPPTVNDPKTKVPGYEIHPLALTFPPLPEAELDALTDSSVNQ